LARNEEMVGRRYEVLVEGPSRKDPATVTARTRGNKPVHYRGDDPAGSYRRVEVERAAPHHLMGRRVR
jgi:tRNA-2-methylthio-N6-dimethylallyladenosine synthase